MVWGRGWRNWKTEVCSLCHRWLRAVLVNWPEKAGLFSIQSLWELECCLCSQTSTGTYSGKWLHWCCSNMMDWKRQTRIPFKKQLWYMYFSDTQSSSPRTQTTALVCFFPPPPCDFCRFVSAARGQQENREMCFPLCGMINDRHTHSDTHTHVCIHLLIANRNASYYKACF